MCLEPQGFVYICEMLVWTKAKSLQCRKWGPWFGTRGRTCRRAWKGTARREEVAQERVVFREASGELISGRMECSALSSSAAGLGMIRWEEELRSDCQI